MGCNDSLGAWMITGTTGVTMHSFVTGNMVTITEPTSDSYTVQVAGTPYDGFSCSASAPYTLTGKVDQDTLQISMPIGVDPRRITGVWNPTEATAGTWTGEEGGGGSDDV